MKKLIPLFLVAMAFFSCNINAQSESTLKVNNMIIRISEIKIDSNFLDEYLSILKEQSEASVRLEQGVVSIYPMYQNENPNEIRILEIYANKDAYESHLQTEHFKHYKTSTLKMVKSLKLIDMHAIDFETMPKIFRKLNSVKQIKQ